MKFYYGTLVLTKDIILNYIKELASNYVLDGGNCGMFALGLAVFLEDTYGEEVALGYVIGNTNDTDLKLIGAGDPEVHHI